MQKRIFPSLLIVAAFTVSLPAAVSLPAETAASLPADATGPAKAAMDAFRDGRHAKAVELAKPLADQGNADALYLLGFAHETGQGIEASREKALEYYRKAADGKQKDAAYRLSFILLASEKKEERDQARLTLENAAKDDPAVAGRILGEAYLRGLLGEKADPDKAAFWWKRAGDAGDIPSLLLIAGLYEGRFGFPEIADPAESLANYAKAAGLGNPGAMATLGSRLLNGDAKTRDEAKGREWLKKAIAAKEYSAYLALGDFEENVKKDLKAALTEYERGKDAGQVDCMLRSASFYLEGKGVEKDAERGVTILKKAAEAGSSAAHFRLAANFLTGEKPDVLAGYGHLVSAANGNLAEAQNELGLFYLAGRLNAADTAAGVAWLARAAQNGSVQAQNNLATLYEGGAAGVPRNLENAVQLYNLAANQGHGPATFALARILSENKGAKPDLVKAWALASLAAERGVNEADKLISDIAAKLDEKQRSEAREQLVNFKSGKPAATEPPKAEEPKPVQVKPAAKKK
jgi:TPR repeat protein